MYRASVGNSEGNSLKEDLGIDGRIMLRRILQKYDWLLWNGFICHRTGISGGVL
jgi:hypothetical protein